MLKLKKNNFFLIVRFPFLKGKKMSFKKEIRQSTLSELDTIAAYDNKLAKQLTKMIKSSDPKVRMNIYEKIKYDDRFNINPQDSIDEIFGHIADRLRTSKDSSSGRYGSARGGFDSRGRSYSLDGLSMVDADSDKAIFRGSLGGASDSRRRNEYSRDSIHDDGTVDVRGGPMTISNRPLTDMSPLAGPYFCPETPDRVKVDGMYVVSRPDDVRGFYKDGDVLVMRILGGNSDDDDKPGTARCAALDIFRKTIRRYEEMYQASSARGSNLIRWTFYYDNGGKSEEETRADDAAWTVPDIEIKRNCANIANRLVRAAGGNDADGTAAFNAVIAGDIANIVAVTENAVRDTIGASADVLAAIPGAVAAADRAQARTDRANERAAEARTQATVAAAPLNRSLRTPPYAFPAGGAAPPAGEPGSRRGTGIVEPLIVLSRFDGREDFGYVFNHRFRLDGVGATKFNENNVLRYFKRESEFSVFMDKIIGDDHAIRFIECDPVTKQFDENMKAAACERVQRYLKSDQTAVIVMPVAFLNGNHGFDEKILALTTIVHNLRVNNNIFFDRIAYYFASGNNPIQFFYSTVTTNINLPDVIAAGGGLPALANVAAPIPLNNANASGTVTVNELVDIQQGSGGVLNRAGAAYTLLNDIYNGGKYRFGPNNQSTTALFQIIRGSKATEIKEIYIVKDAPDLNQTMAFTELNDMTRVLMRENVMNAARIPYVTENLLNDFVSRRNIFPMMTSEASYRKFYVRQVLGEPFKIGGNNPAFLFRYEQLPDDVLMDLKNGVGVIVYPECDGTEGSCVPPQLSAMAQRLKIRLVSAPLKHFQSDGNVRLVGLRCHKRLSHNNYDLYIQIGMSDVNLAIDGRFYDNDGNAIAANNNCRLSSVDISIRRFMEFFNNEKIAKKKYMASCEDVTPLGGAAPRADQIREGIIVPIK